MRFPESKFYYIKSKTMALAIQYISGLSFMVFDDKDDSSIKTYAFDNTEKLHEVLTDLTNIRNKYRKN